MYHVQWEIESGKWGTDEEFECLDEALRYAIVAARNVRITPYRILRVKMGRKVKVLAKFKPMRGE